MVDYKHLKTKNNKNVPPNIISHEASRWFKAKWVVNQEREDIESRKQDSEIGERIFQTND